MSCGLSPAKAERCPAVRTGTMSCGPSPSLTGVRIRAIRVVLATALIVLGLLLSVADLWKGRLIVSITGNHGIDTSDLVAICAWIMAGVLLLAGRRSSSRRSRAHRSNAASQ